MQNVIIGTAGHIDHGKTTLIKALTGRSTDKLAEEIKRGISINLGFTYFDLPSGNRAGIVDVPGHERFIKNMLAGATGIDVVLLTVAANEGVKPQTIEHAAILSYLDIKERIIVLTKRDLVDSEMLELVTDDVREGLAGTVFHGAEILEVDSVSGYGLKTLVSKIDDISKNVPTKNEKAAARLPIDRVFSLKGFGTIVTGTLSEGKVSVGDELSVYPKMEKAKIRGVQVHDQAVETAYAGQRAALNISNIKKEELERGHVLAQTGTLAPTFLLDVRLSLVNHGSVTLKLWDRVRVYMGAAEVLARVVPLDCDNIEQGMESYCQLRLEKEAVAKKNDRFVIRTFSPLATIGGGVVLDPNPKKHGKADKKALEALKAFDGGGVRALAEEFIRRKSFCALSDIASCLSVDAQEAQNIANLLEEERSVVKINKLFFHIDALDAFSEACIANLSKYHEKFPLRRGMLKEELKSRTCSKEFDALLKMLESQQEIRIIDNTLVALYSFRCVYTPQQQKMREHIEKRLESAGFSPPPMDEVLKGLPKGGADVLESLAGTTVVMLDGQTAIFKAHYDKAKEALLCHLKNNGRITLADFRDLINSSRKYAVLLLDSFDKAGITVRVGDERVLRKG